MGPGSFLAVFCFWIFLGTGCTTLRPDFVQPSVSVISFKPLSSPNLAPRFEIGMRVLNPNSARLSLRGMSYKLFLNDYEVVEGAANELPAVPTYGEAEFKVIATIDLFESIRFVSDMLRNAPGQVTYRFQARIDTGSMNPTILIEKTGSFSP